MKNLKFYKISEKKPRNKQDIWYIHHSTFYSNYEFRFGKIYYEYYELDCEGQETGTSYYDRPPKQGEENYNPNFTYKLYCMFESGSGLSSSIDDDAWWAPARAIEKSLFGNEK